MSCPKKNASSRFRREPNPNQPWIDFQIEDIDIHLEDSRDIRAKADKHGWSEVVDAFDKIIAHLNRKRAKLCKQKELEHEEI